MSEQSRSVLMSTLQTPPFPHLRSAVQNCAELLSERLLRGECEPLTASTVLDNGPRGRGAFPPSLRPFQNRTFLLCCDKEKQFYVTVQRLCHSKLFSDSVTLKQGRLSPDPWDLSDSRQDCECGCRVRVSPPEQSACGSLNSRMKARIDRRSPDSPSSMARSRSCLRRNECHRCKRKAAQAPY